MRLEGRHRPRLDGLGLRQGHARLGQPDPQQRPEKLFQVSGGELHAGVEEVQL